MKKILFLVTSLGGGGAERVLVNLLNNLDPKKYDIYLKTLFDVGVNRKYLGSHIHYLPGLKKQFSGNVAVMKLFSPKALYRFFVGKRRFDIVISYLEGPPARVASGCPDRECRKICWVHREHNTAKAAAKSFRSFAEAQKCYLRFDTTVFVSKTVQQDLNALFRLSGRQQVLYNTNEDQRIRELAREPVEDFQKPGVPCVFSIGRLSREKGFDRLLRVHKALLEQGVAHEVFILGEGPIEKELRKSIRDCGAEDTFHLLGFRENPYRYLAQADLFVCSSRKEGISTAVTESLILGVPVVSTRCSGAEELLGAADEYGIVTDHDEAALLAGVKTMLTAPETLAHYRAKAKERGMQFSKEATLQAVEALLDE